MYGLRARKAGPVKPELRLAERYRLMERLDDGDAMEVWRAWDEALSRSVAIKLPDPVRLGGADRVRDFDRLASRAAGVPHAGFAAIYDCDRTRDAAGRSVPYLVTEYLEGESLAARLDRAPLPAGEALEICARVAAALAVAHRDGVTHGDLTPRRVFLTPGGVKIVDVGIGAVLRSAPARACEPAEPAAGTAPVEARVGRAAAEADDVRAFGELLAACLDAGPAAARVPDEVALLRDECRAADPGERPPMSRVADVLTRAAAPSASVRDRIDLASLSAGRGDAPRPGADGGRDLAGGRGDQRTELLDAPPPPGPPPADRRPVLIAAVAVAAAAVIAMMIALNRPAPAAREVAAPQPPPAGGVSAAPAETPSEAPAPDTEPSAPFPSAPFPSAPFPSEPVPSEPVPSEPPAAREAADTGLLGLLGRLQPIVDGAQATGRMRPDVAVDLNNHINNLRNELVTGHAVDADSRVEELRRRIDTRLRERALTPDAAAELTRVLDDHDG
ncbi:hypothetical protein Arub01_00130 [Actinomadura rubrobrunea]|uniref:non-specific serine/threonine protein kinase n=1 Tax=Actinomadura rubrobrunea TaxID=115335 RepID=A0A9W6PNG6_9ACTN|nr:protein kinase [Actinomadura rubrobrunea]GLW61769.1 hypothetical protein Arub01_00130 [Actinomadura rubrobrunea]